MRASLFLLFLVMAVYAASEWYILHQIRQRVRSHRRFWWHLDLWGTVAMLLLLVGVMVIPADKGSYFSLEAKMWMLFAFMTVYVPKMIGVIFDLLASIPRLFGHKRIKALTVTGLVLAVAIFIGMWWGSLINRFRIQVNEVTVEVDGLPQQFDGFRIAQFSDLHTGTFGSDTGFVDRLVSRINSLGADAVMFTGDIVNRQSSEITPFVTSLSRLHAPAGVYAILGNHDYGDYMMWESPEMKKANMDSLFMSYRRTGIDLILNDTRWIRRGNDSIAVIGVENIGEPPFSVYGSLKKAYPTLGDSNTKILLTHNPRHWVDSIAGHDDINVALSLSGHTHAMQIELAGISPAALRYDTWGGLYADSGSRHQLYVNIGSGTVGIPMRLGATPEITIITLRRRK